MSSFCTAKATHIFFSKKFQHICVSLDVNFNESLTNDVVSFEQLGPDIYGKCVIYCLQQSKGSIICWGLCNENRGLWAYVNVQISLCISIVLIRSIGKHLFFSFLHKSMFVDLLESPFM